MASPSSAVEDSYRKNILIDKDASVLEITDLGGQQGSFEGLIVETCRLTTFSILR
jgi:hypothetical protein